MEANGTANPSYQQGRGSPDGFIQIDEQSSELGLSESQRLQRIERKLDNLDRNMKRYTITKVAFSALSLVAISLGVGVIWYYAEDIGESINEAVGLIQKVVHSIEGNTLPVEAGKEMVKAVAEQLKEQGPKNLDHFS